MYFIGIDGGGTKTEAVLCDQTGRIAARALGGPSNPNDAGMEKAAGNISAVIFSLCAQSGIAAENVCSVFGGISGGINYAAGIYEALRALFPEKCLVHNASDATNIISCGLLTSDGCGVISGTGSACFVRKKEQYTRIGGWGYLLDSAGSGYDIGRDCIAHILRAHDGRGEPTLLSELYHAQFGRPAELDITAIYQNGKTYIASAAPLVFEAERRGDRTAAAIIDRNMAGLAECIQTAATYFLQNEKPFSTVLGGGIFRNDAALRVLKTKVTCETVVELLPAAPVFGAVVEAMRYSGVVPTAAVREAFTAEYENAPCISISHD